MTIDKFGRSLKSRGENLKDPKGEGFNLTPNGDYDMQNKRLCKLAPPVEPLDAVNKSYVDYNSILSDTVKYSMQNKRVWELANPEDPSDAVNLRTLKKLCMTTVFNDNYNAQEKQINNLAMPTDPGDAATKSYVDSTCEKTISPLTTEIKTRLAKCEGLIASNKDIHDKDLRKLGTMIYNYINRKNRAALAEDDWEELFKVKETSNEEDDREEYNIDPSDDVFDLGPPVDPLGEAK